MSRYFIQTEHIRGEKRIYWVEDSHKTYGRSHVQVTEHTTDQRKAQRQCGDLNENDAALSNGERK